MELFTEFGYKILVGDYVKKSLLIFLSAIFLGSIGILMIYSASSIWSDYRFGDTFHYVTHQGLFFLVGLIGIYVLSRVDYKLYKKDEIIYIENVKSDDSKLLSYQKRVLSYINN